MRGFISLLVFVALATHFGQAGAPSLGTPFPSGGDVASGLHAGPQALLPAALGTTQAEATTDPRGRTGGPDPRRTLPEARLCAPGIAIGFAARTPDARTPSSLLGFPGNPTTAPPSQA